MAGYLLLKLNKGKNSYGFLGIRNYELYTDYNINDGAKFYSFEEAKPYINKLVKAGFEVRLWGTGDFSKDNFKFGRNPFTKIIKENKNMQEKTKKLSESIKERVLEKRLGGKSEIQENSYHAEEHEGKWVIKDEAGYIMTTDRFDTKEEAEADIAKHGQPKEQTLPVENARVKRVEESKINEAKAPEKLTDDMIKFIYDNRNIANTSDLLEDLILNKKIIDFTYKFKEGGYEKLLELYPEVKKVPLYVLKAKNGDYIDSIGARARIMANSKDSATIYTQSDIDKLKDDNPKMMRDVDVEKINEGNYDSDNAWLGFCTNIKRYANEHQVDIEEAIQSEFDDLYAYADIINIWRDMPGDLGSRIGEITFLMLEDIREGAYEDVDFISGLEESKMNEISDRTKNRALAARDKRAKAALDKQNRWNRHRFQEPSDEFKDVKTEEDAMAIHKTAWKETDKMWKNARRQPNMDTYKKRVRSGAISLGKDKSNVNEDNNLQQIFDDAFSGGTIPAIETANGVMYLEPKDNKIIIGGATNAGIIPQYEFEYDFSQSFDWNIQGMIEQVYEQEGYPDEEWNENHKARKSMKKSVNENMSVAKAKKLYKKHGMLFLDDEEGQEAYDVLYNAGYTMKKKNDVAYCVEFDRMRESLERRKSAKKSVNEISDELASKVTSARRKELKNADRAFAKARTKAWKDTEGMDPANRLGAMLNNKKLDKVEDRTRKAGRKLGNNFTLNKLRDKRKAQNESLAETLLREAHSVLTMNENESSELTTWQFTARGFSKAMIEKQSVFGSANIRCIIHENADGKVVGTAVADYYMDEVQVEEAIKKALAENGFKATSITDLVNLY